MLQFTCDECQIVVTDDYGYTPGSADDPRPYDRVHDLTDGEFRPTSRHAVAVGCGGAQLRSCVVLAGGGASGVHEH